MVPARNKVKRFSFVNRITKKFIIICFCILVDNLILFNEHAFIWKKDRDLPLSSKFSNCISSTSEYLDFTTFSESIFCSGEEVLN